MKDYEMEDRPKRSLNPLKFFFSKDAEEGNVPNRELLSYSAALAGQNAAYGIVGQWIFYFCTNVLHMNPDHVGKVTSVSRIWDALNDPLVGVIIDRRKYKPGQKLHPFLGKLPVVIGLLTALLFVNFGFGETGSIIAFLLIYLFWDLTYSFQDTALWGTMSLISPHSAERGRVSQWLNIGAGAGMGIVGVIPMLLGIGEKLNISLSQQFLCYGIVFGFGGELLSALAAKTKERVAYTKEEKQPFLRDLADLRHNKILILLLLAQVVSFFDGAIPWIYFFEYCTSYQIGSIEINGQTAQFIYGILINIFGSLSMFFATTFAKKLGGMRNVIIIAKVTNIVTRCIAFFHWLPNARPDLRCDGAHEHRRDSKQHGRHRATQHSVRFGRLRGVEDRQADRRHQLLHAESDEQAAGFHQALFLRQGAQLPAFRRQALRGPAESRFAAVFHCPVAAVYAVAGTRLPVISHPLPLHPLFQTAKGTGRAGAH